MKWFVTLSFVLTGMLPMLVRAEDDGMIMIEIVEDPSFFELYEIQLYFVVISAFLGIFFWRRYKQKKVKA